MKKALTITGLLYFISVLITALLYAIDSDPAYANPWLTVREFVIISVIVMAFVTSVAGVGAAIYLLVVKPIIEKARG